MTGNDYRISSLLIATDGSAYADVAAECSAWLATRLEARITALATALGFAPSQYLTVSYARLHAERAAALGIGPHMTFPA